MQRLKTEESELGVHISQGVRNGMAGSLEDRVLGRKNEDVVHERIEGMSEERENQ